MKLRFVLALSVMAHFGCGVDDRGTALRDSDNAPGQEVSKPAPSADAVPPHRVIENIFLPPDRGRRIHLAVDTLITTEECRRLVEHYRGRARPGQVAVQLPGQGALCVDNFDGRGTVIHDWMWR